MFTFHHGDCQVIRFAFDVIKAKLFLSLTVLIRVLSRMNHFVSILFYNKYRTWKDENCVTIFSLELLVVT